MKSSRTLSCRTVLPALILSLAANASPALGEPEQTPSEPPERPEQDEPEKKSTAQARPTSQQIARALRAYDREPRVATLVAVALRVAAADPQKAAEMASRARLAGLAPTLRLAVRRGLNRDLSETQTFETDRYDLSTDDDLVLEGSLTFDLGRLVFEHDEIALAREQREAVRARREVAGAVVGLYFERRRLQLERELLGGADLKREVRIAELEALLDAFTDGAFRRMIVSIQRRKSGKP